MQWIDTCETGLDIGGRIGVVFADSNGVSLINHYTDHNRYDIVQQTRVIAFAKRVVFDLGMNLILDILMIDRLINRYIIMIINMFIYIMYWGFSRTGLACLGFSDTGFSGVGEAGLCQLEFKEGSS